MFRSTLGRIRSEASDTAIACKDFLNRLKLLAQASDSNMKMFNELKKSEVAAYKKNKETLNSKLLKIFEAGKKASALERDLKITHEIVEAGVSSRTGQPFNPIELNDLKNKLAALTTSRTKAEAEYSKMKSEMPEMIIDFNKKKQKFWGLFNAYSENIDSRIRDNLSFFLQKFHDFVNGIKLNRGVEGENGLLYKPLGSPGDLRSPRSPKGETNGETTIPKSLWDSVKIESDKDKDSLLPVEPKPYSSVNINLSEPPALVISSPARSISSRTVAKRIMTDYLEFETEKIPNPDDYVFLDRLSSDNAELKREIDKWYNFGSQWSEERAAVSNSVSMVVTARKSIGEMIKASGPSCGLRSYSTRLAVALVYCRKSHGKLNDQTEAEVVRDALLSACLQYLQTDESQDNYDKQYLFYHIKLLDLLHYPSDIKTNIYGCTTQSRSLLSLVPSSPLFQQALTSLKFASNTFWENYFRQHNYFLDKNQYLLDLTAVHNPHNPLARAAYLMTAASPLKAKNLTRALSLVDIMAVCLELNFGYPEMVSHVKAVISKYKVDFEASELAWRGIEDRASYGRCDPKYSVEIVQRHGDSSPPVPIVPRRISKDGEEPSKGKFEIWMWKGIVPYLKLKESLELVRLCKQFSRIIKEQSIGTYLSNYNPSSDRADIWYQLVPSEIKKLDLKPADSLTARLCSIGDGLEETIDMDLTRSITHFDQSLQSSIKTVLVNIAVTYPQIGYYQGMNYLAIFIFSITSNEERKSFHLLAYLTERFLIKNFGDAHGGLNRLIWTTDRLLERNTPRLWEKLKRLSVGALHFATPNLITLLTSLIKNKETIALVPLIWDLMFREGIFFIYKMVLYILDVQKAHIEQVDTDELLHAMRNVDEDPFSVIRLSGVGPGSLSSCIAHLHKDNMKAIDYCQKIFARLDSFYDQFIWPTQIEWDKKTTADTN